MQVSMENIVNIQFVISQAEVICMFVFINKC